MGSTARPSAAAANLGLFLGRQLYHLSRREVIRLRPVSVGQEQFTVVEFISDGALH